MPDDLHPIPRDDLLSDIEFALSQSSNYWPKRRRLEDDHPYRPIALKVLEHLQLSGVKCYRKPPDLGQTFPIRGET